MFKRRAIIVLSVLLCLSISVIGLSGCMKKKQTSVGSDQTLQNQPTESESTDPNIGKREITVNVEWKPVTYEKKVKPYIVNKDMKNIENIEQFGTFTQKQLELIKKNGFVVVPSQYKQLHYIYDDNQYKKIPSFITADSVLQVYHIFYDYSLRTLEFEKLHDVLEQLTQNMLEESIKQYGEVSEIELKNASVKNIAFFGIAQKLLEKNLPSSMPEEAKQLVEKEYNLISKQEGIQESSIFPFKMDYSQYTPRGHYTRNETLKKYFKTMMWYGQVPFPVDKERKNKEQVIQAMLITHTLFFDKGNVSNKELWEKIYDPTVFYVGSTDDLNIYHIKDLMIKAYGNQPEIQKLNENEKIDKFYNEAWKIPEPQIKGKLLSGMNIPVGKQFRFMGQRYVPDSEILQELTDPFKRVLPKGLDVMAVLGSERAHNILINTYKENENWEKYSETFSKMKDKFTKVEDNKWRSNMYYGWLWSLKALLNTYGEGYPSFMRNEAWNDKSLSTALGSWSELRHDTILYAKQGITAECGGDDEEPPYIRGYVEPNVELYERLLWLTKYSRENLKQKEILSSNIESRMQDFEDLLNFLLNCSLKELRNEELTREEYDKLMIYGGTIEYLTNSLADSSNDDYTLTSEVDKNMAVIADVHTATSGRYLEEGVGNAAEIYVVVPINGKLYMTRGGVFTYYEFISEKRLTDEEWQKLVEENKQPQLPGWTNSFIDGVNKEVPIPKKPYSTGC